MEEKIPKTQHLNEFIFYKLEWITHCDESKRKAVLAEMRHGIGKLPGDDPDLWFMMFKDLPEELEGNGYGATKEENAIYYALTLYALHQQGKDLTNEFMHLKGCSLGHAVAKLAAKDGDERTFETVRRRFNIMATSADEVELVWHLRGIIQLLRKESIALDYAKLAEDLYNYQFADKVSTVRLNWGRDFYSKFNKLTKESASDKGKEESDEK